MYLHTYVCSFLKYACSLQIFQCIGILTQCIAVLRVCMTHLVPVSERAHLYCVPPLVHLSTGYSMWLQWCGIRAWCVVYVCMYVFTYVFT